MKFYPLVLLLFLTACTQSVAEVKSEAFVGEDVTLKGVVQGTFKLGELSGYTLTDKQGDKISVSSLELPAEGSTVTVRGVIKQGPLGIGYYLDAKE